ncbi:MAG: helix-turn-helix domain-containing protein [Myxococcales bacterium]|nr:helix-turn-helix domain-containing protein [Myxococcales bacterium]
MTSPPWAELLRDRIRALRAERDWSQRQLAERSGLSLRFLGQLEAGRANVSLARLMDLALALDVSVVTLMAGLGPVRDPADAVADHVRQLDVEAQQDALALLRPPAVNKVVLVGLRGAGKSTVGRAVAEQLDLSFVLVDERVQQQAGLQLADLFEMHGPAGYLRLCREVLGEVLGGSDPAVVEVGGSVVTDEAAWGLLQRHARVVWLHATPQAHLQRVAAQGDARPMAGYDDALPRLKQILTRREPYYRRADFRVDTVELGLTGAIGEVVAIAGALLAT